MTMLVVVDGALPVDNFRCCIVVGNASAVRAQMAAMETILRDFIVEREDGMEWNATDKTQYRFVQ